MAEASRFLGIATLILLALCGLGELSLRLRERKRRRGYRGRW